MSSVTTLATSGSDGGSTLGGLDQSCGDFVLMASPIRGKLSQPCSLTIVFDTAAVDIDSSEEVVPDNTV